MNGASASTAREELRESSLRIESLSAQLAGLQKEVISYSIFYIIIIIIIITIS